MVTSNGDHVTLVGLGAPVPNLEGAPAVTVLDSTGRSYLVFADDDAATALLTDGTTDGFAFDGGVITESISVTGADYSNTNPYLVPWLAKQMHLSVASLVPKLLHVYANGTWLLLDEGALSCTPVGDKHLLTVTANGHNYPLFIDAINDSWGSGFVGCDYENVQPIGVSEYCEAGLIDDYPRDNGMWGLYLNAWAFYLLGCPRYLFEP